MLRTVSPRRPATLAGPAALALAAVLTLSGCQQAEDAAKDAANDAACSAVRSAVDQAGNQAQNAVDEIGADPKAAEQDLRDLRDALAAAENGVSGDVEAGLVKVKTQVERLLGQAQDAAQGAEVDTSAVQDAKADLDQSIEDVKNLC